MGNRAPRVAGTRTFSGDGLEPTDDVRYDWGVRTIRPRPRRRPAPRPALRTAVAGAALVGLLAGCAGGGEQAADGGAQDPTSEDSGVTTDAGEDVTVLQPGAPGEPAATVRAEDVEIQRPFNAADATFLVMMIPHHEQALEMSDLALAHARDPQVRSLAERIRAAQGPEISYMESLLDRQGLDRHGSPSGDGSDDGHGAHGSHGGVHGGSHDHSGMAGMLTPAEMARLSKARGRAFDRLFLSGMIAHHEGAITMADEVAVAGVDVAVSELAADVALSQSAEIGRMRLMLQRL